MRIMGFDFEGGRYNTAEASRYHNSPEAGIQRH